MKALLMALVATGWGSTLFGATELCNRPATNVTSVEIDTLASGYSEFSFDLFDKLKESSGNLFLSPYSISTALSMTLAGARESTEASMRTSLDLDSIPADRLHIVSQALMRSINCREDAAYELVTANSIWVREGYSLRPAFVDLLKNDYGSEVKTLDFLRATEASRLAINNWVEDKTNDKIKDLIPEGAITGNTHLVLTNAIYYKGAWMYPFPEQLTSNLAFWASGTDSVSVPTMKQTRTLPFVETAELRAVALPLLAKDGEPQAAQELLILLPKDRNGLAALEDSIDATKMRAIVDGMREEMVQVQLPKFKFASSFSLKEALSSLGMGEAFDAGSANFSGMSPDDERELYISDAFHKGFIDVNEKGIEAAAATAIIMGRTSAPQPVSFVADHPFLFAILDKETKTILFLGRLVDPR